MMPLGSYPPEACDARNTVVCRVDPPPTAHNKRHRPLPSPEHHPAPTPPNITQSHTLSSPLVTIPEHIQLEGTETHAVLPSPPRPPNECPPPAPRAPPNRNSRPKNALLATDMSPPPSAKRQCPRSAPPTRRQPKRAHPDSELTPPPPTTKSRTQHSNAPSLGRNKKGSEGVAKQGPRKKKTPHI